MQNILIRKLTDLDFPASTCKWIYSFLTDRPQTVRMGTQTSSTLTLSTGSPQGCVLSPFLYSLYTHDCVPAHHSNVIVKFADDTTVMGLISNGDETAYREEVQRLTAWCSANNLLLNASKTKEMIFDWSGTRGDLTPLQIDGVCVERVSFKFLGMQVSKDLTWHTNTTLWSERLSRGYFF